jgi:HK97 gp10 family phage protein
MDLKYKISGLDGIAKTMAQLPKSVERKLAIASLRGGGKIIVDAARLLAPVGSGARYKYPFRGKRRRPGALRRSITQRAKRGFVPTLQIGIRSGAAPHAHMVEFGTSKMAARPFLRPALDTNKDKVIRVTGNSLGPAIEKEAARLRRR